jgi:hypothetical protein
MREHRPGAIAMLHKCLGALAVTLAIVGFAAAEEYTAKVKSTDTDKGTITFTVDGKDMTLPVHKECDIYTLTPAKKKGQPAVKNAVEGNLGGLKPDQSVTLTTQKKDDKETVLAIKVEQTGKKKKKKAE